MDFYRGFMSEILVQIVVTPPPLHGGDHIYDFMEKLVLEIIKY